MLRCGALSGAGSVGAAGRAAAPGVLPAGWASRGHPRLRLLPVQPEEDQKLIYAGKLLLDHAYLGELLPKVCILKNPRSAEIHQEKCLFSNTSSCIFQHGELHALHLVYSCKMLANVPQTTAEVLKPGCSYSGAVAESEAGGCGAAVLHLLV